MIHITPDSNSFRLQIPLDPKISQLCKIMVSRFLVWFSNVILKIDKKNIIMLLFMPSVTKLNVGRMRSGLAKGYLLDG